MLENFHQVVKNRHRYAKEWKTRTGGKVVGCFCSYVPEEILYAAGILPVRLLGSNEPQDISESHIASMFCP
ncbi:MAG: 2-hydroxyacyl-CoA dehydratase family protein, partial [Dehalococcoidia bacterium]|nr:2-hydroxyacyl-CoA dehydratase family protein [Dehalococcoidia bacterium]